MNTQRRFRIRFSVRTLAVFVTLVCVYFGAWEATKRFGTIRTSGVTKSKGSVWIDIPAGSLPPDSITVASDSPAPFIVSRSEYHFEYIAKSSQQKRYSVSNGTVHYYLWLFGPAMKLPLESTW